MTSFTDFQAGLGNVNDYLNGRNTITGTVSVGSDALRLVGAAQYSFTLKELMCSIISGNGIKLPNLQVALQLNIQSLLSLPNLQDELADALNRLLGGLENFMNHTGIDEILGRMQLIVSEAQNVANLLNFCGRPIDPVAIPNMIQNAFGSFLGEGKGILDQIGVFSGTACDGIPAAGFNASAFVGGVLGQLASNLDAVINGALSIDFIENIVKQVESILDQINNIIDKETNILGAYIQGGSQFAEPDPNCNSEVGVMHNPFSNSVRSNARITSALKALYDNLGGYPVVGNDGTEYPNIFHLLVDPELLEILQRDDDPSPNIESQTPVYDYCGNIIGYTSALSQGTKEKSAGTEPTIPTNRPGFAAGGNTTTEEPTSPVGSFGSTTTIINTTSGNAVYIVSSEINQISLQINTNDIVVRSDILTIFVRKDTATFNTGTMSDYQQSSVTFSLFGTSVNELTGEGFVLKDGSSAIARTFEGTDNQIIVFNGNGKGGNVRYALANDTIIPGAGAIKIPAGPTSQRPAGEVGKVRYNVENNRVEAYYNNTASWRQFATLDDLSQEATSIINIGSGIDLYKRLNPSNEHEFRRINKTGLITLTENDNDITIGDNLTVSNVGTGTGIFRQRTNNNLELKTLTSSNNITITNTDTTVNIAGDERIHYARIITSDNIPNIVSSLPSLPLNTTWFFTIKVLAGRDSTKRAWKLEGVVQDVNGTQTLVGPTGGSRVVTKTDFQRNTTDVEGLNTWQPNRSYLLNDKVEYNLIEYTATADNSGYVTPDLSPNWIPTYTGWNVEADIIGGNFVIRVRGATSETVNWSIKLEFVDL